MNTDRRTGDVSASNNVKQALTQSHGLVLQTLASPYRSRTELLRENNDTDHFLSRIEPESDLHPGSCFGSKFALLSCKAASNDSRTCCSELRHKRISSTSETSGSSDLAPIGETRGYGGAGNKSCSSDIIISTLARDVGASMLKQWSDRSDTS